MKLIRQRKMTLDEQEAASKSWKIKSPQQRLWDGDMPFESEKYAEWYYSLWVIKEEYDDTPKVDNDDTCNCCRCCECSCEDIEPCTCNERNANGECVNCIGDK